MVRGNGTKITLVSINYVIRERAFKNISLYTLYHINYARLFVTCRYIVPVNLRVPPCERGKDKCVRQKLTSAHFHPL